MTVRLDGDRPVLVGTEQGRARLPEALGKELGLRLFLVVAEISYAALLTV